SALLFATMAPMTASGLSDRLALVFEKADQFELSGNGFGIFFNDLAAGIVLVGLLPLVVLAICAVAGNLVQHAPLLSIEPIIPKLNRISPIAGAKRLVSGEALVNFVKG